MLTVKRIWIPLAASALALAAFSLQAEEMRFGAKLTGAAQLPEPPKSTAEGEIKLVVGPDAGKISYTLSVTNLSNITGADLHLGLETANGPVVVKLFPLHGAAPKKGPFTGVLAEGTITAADLTGPMRGGSLADLIDELREGETYVNVHTDDGVAPQNTGPGDYHLGEIRGQIK
ncbi:MAG: CHRD domain-containing protein [Gammaproteobacteria bacterium]|nr:CHRD domain-containing protein [Gammaproteobacteria bacterium]